MTDFIRIGEYQLRNLLHNRVKFLFLDLSVESTVPEFARELLIGSRKVSASDVMECVRQSGSAFDAPIVLICENGAKSVAAAQELARNSFINVFVVDGGIQALEF